MGRAVPRTSGPLLIALILVGCAGPAETPTLAGPDRSAAWDGAMTHAAFVAGDTANHALWRDNGLRGAPADLVARARQVGGEWKLLVVAESWCSDAVFVVPHLAALADSVPGLELRLLRTGGNDALFAGHDKDGRIAHPLVLVLDGAGRERAAWVERPAELAAWIDARRGELTDDELRLYRRGWYAGNGGRTALGEVLDLMDAVRDGRAPVVAAAPTGGERDVTPCPAPGD